MFNSNQDGSTVIGMFDSHGAGQGLNPGRSDKIIDVPIDAANMLFNVQCWDHRIITTEVQF